MIGVGTPDEEECVSYKELQDMMKSMTELFTKNKKSTDTSLARVECSVADVIDQVDALEARLPLPDNAKPVEEIPEDCDEQEEPLDPPHPPLRQNRDK
jgi:hypothetical protein